MALTDTLIFIGAGALCVLCSMAITIDGVSRILEKVSSSATQQYVREQLDISEEDPLRLTSLMSRLLDSRIFNALLAQIPVDYIEYSLEVVRKIDPRRRLRAQQFAQQLPDALDQIAQALGAGLSLPQAVDRASHYLPDPIGVELRRVHSHMTISHSFERSFTLLREDFDCKELELVCSGIAVQSKLGGNMKEMLQRTARYCRQSQSLARSLRAQTAQSRLSLRIILFAPFILVAVLSILMPSFLTNLVFTSIGRTMLFIALLLDGIGVAWARSIMRFEKSRG